MLKACTCGICQGGCQVLVTIEDDRIVKVQPNLESAHARLCARGALAPQILYGEGRLRRPLIRIGKRGEGRFREASWEEAFEVAARLLKETIQKYGGKSLASYYGRGVLGTPVTRMGNNREKELSFLYRLGSSNDMNCGSICNTASSTIAPVSVMGIGTRQMMQEIEESEFIFSWGKNSMTDDGPQTMLKRIKKAKQRGAKLIVIDPRKKGMGELADWWLPILPGSDGALALAMLKLLIRDGRYEKEFVEKYTLGFEKFCRYLDTLEMERLSGWCGIRKEDIKKLTDLFCSSSKISLVSYTGLEYQLSGIQNNRAIYVLWAITGKLDVPGGIYLNVNQANNFALRKMPELQDMPIGAREYPVFYKFTGNGQFSCIPKAILEDQPYPIRGMLIIGGSPMLSFPETRKWREAYKKLECLLVSDRYLTEDARYADVVFPARTLFECPKAISDENGRKVIQEPVIPPVEGTRDDVMILSGIAEKLGVGYGYPTNEKELRNWLIQAEAPCADDFSTGTNHVKKYYKKYETGRLRADGKPGFPTPSGKFEICSSLFEKNGITPYPEYLDIHSLKEINYLEYPMIMTSGARSNNRMGVFGTNVPQIATIEPVPLVDISKEDAEQIGIKNGEQVRVITPFGRGNYQANICEIARHSVHIPHGGGSTYMPKAWREGNVNELCSLEYRDEISGFVMNKSVPCRIEKISQKE